MTEPSKDAVREAAKLPAVFANGTVIANSSNHVRISFLETYQGSDPEGRASVVMTHDTAREMANILLKILDGAGAPTKELQKQEN